MNPRARDDLTIALVQRALSMPAPVDRGLDRAAEMTPDNALRNARSVLASAAEIFDPRGDRSLHTLCRAATLSIDDSFKEQAPRPEQVAKLLDRTAPLLSQVAGACQEKRLFEFAVRVDLASSACKEARIAMPGKERSADRALER